MKNPVRDLKSYIFFYIWKVWWNFRFQNHRIWWYIQSRHLKYPEIYGDALRGTCIQKPYKVAWQISTILHYCSKFTVIKWRILQQNLRFLKLTKISRNCRFATSVSIDMIQNLHWFSKWFCDSTLILSDSQVLPQWFYSWSVLHISANIKIWRTHDTFSDFWFQNQIIDAILEVADPLIVRPCSNLRLRVKSD